ncbi:MAG: hypothetical protein Q8O03_02730 [Nanoarchaeota archaeon]|nr:hypothetical protein [Nanoarchaeota archaeon]
MNKNTIAKLFVIIVLLILLSFSIRASIFATIGMKGLSFASPQAAGVVQNVMKAYQITTDPSGFITGEITGKLTGEIMGEIAKQSPEVAKAIQQYQQVDGWVKEGAKITEDLKLNEKGQQVGGVIELNKKQNVESITDKKISEVENMKLSSSGEGKPYQLKASENGASATIGGNTYSNLQKGSTINVNRETGKVDEMDATFTKATTIKVNEDEIKVPEGARVVYKDGKYDVYGKDQEVEINKQKIQINGENSINYDGKKITGKDFTYDEKRFTGVGDKPAEMTPVEEGYLMGKNTKMEDNRMIINSEKGEVLYSEMCGDVSGFNSYVSPCAKKLTAEGDGFSVKLKEGKQFGLDIEKDDIFEYKLEGGKVTLDNGQQTMDLSEGKSVVVKNGGAETTYVKLAGVDQELISWENMEDFDVSMSSIYDNGGMGNTINEETGGEIVYTKNCGETPTGGVIGGSISGMITFENYCSVVGINKKHSMLGKNWGDKNTKVTGISNVIEYNDGKTKTYSMFVRTQETSGEQWYSLSSNGEIYKYNREKGAWELTQYKNQPSDLISTWNLQATLADTPAPPNETPTSKIIQTGPVVAAEDLGKKVETAGGYRPGGYLVTETALPSVVKIVVDGKTITIKKSVVTGEWTDPNGQTYTIANKKATPD